MAGKVLVIGDVITDIIVAPEGPILRGTDRKATIRMLPGGSGANQAVWLASMGIEAILAGRVGAADLDTWRDHFAARGVTPHLAADPTLPTGSLVSLIDPADGERSFLTDRGANATLSDDDLPLSLLDDLAWLHVSGYALLEPAARNAVVRLMRAARERAILVSVDPASTGFLDHIGPKAFLTAVQGADYALPNADEAAFLSGETTPSAQCTTLTAYFGTVIIKRGALGAITSEGIELPAKIVPVVDTTGAGDAFLAGYIAGTLNGSDPLATAIAAGARAVQHYGAQPIDL
jgi:sugar/nucleoside kinase (ribokinase family)